MIRNFIFVPMRASMTIIFQQFSMLKLEGHLSQL